MSGFDKELTLVLLLTGCSALIMSLSDVLNAAMVGMERMSYSALAIVVPKAAFTVLLIAVLVPGGRCRRSCGGIDLERCALVRDAVVLLSTLRGHHVAVVVR